MIEKPNQTFQSATKNCLDLELRPSEEMLVRDASAVIPMKTIEHLASNAIDGHGVVEAWLQTLDGNWKDNEYGGVFVASLFQAYFDSSHPLARQIEKQFQFRSSRSGAPLTRQGSWFEATRRLTGMLFHLGRLGEPTPSKEKWLSKVLGLTEYLLTNDRSMKKPANLVRCSGFRGVSCVLLARSAADPVKYYKEAAECLRRSRDFGDKTLENGQYLAESYLHLCELSRDETWLPNAEAVIDELYKDPRASRRTFAIAGEATLQRGFAWLKAQDAEKAFKCFATSEADLSKALEMPADPTTDNAYILRVRGRCRYMLVTTATRLGQPTLVGKLDGAIADLETKGDDGKPIGYGGITLPTALFIRARFHREAGELPQTFDGLVKAHRAATEVPDAEELRRSIRVTQAALTLQDAIATNDPAAIVEAFHVLISYRDTGNVPFAPLAHAARAAVKLAPSFGEKLASSVVAEAESALATGELEPSQRQFVASHAGGLALHLARQSGNSSDFFRAYALYRVATAERVPDAAPETFGLAGDTALRIAKLLLANGLDDEAQGYFEDAISHFSDAMAAFARPQLTRSETFKEVVAHSKLGECALRLNALNGDANLLDIAIASFQKSKELGNDSAELAGLLGDAFYRRGQRKSDVADLRRCVQLKEEARRGRDASRENMSVSARVHFRIAQLTGETTPNREGLVLLGQTLRLDPHWPWPLFQMLELSRQLPELHREEIATGLSDETLPLHLRNAFRMADENLIYDEAIGCVLRNDEFERKRLGGRQAVYVVDDPHRLLSESYVFKHTPRANAERDQQTILSFRQFLQRHNSPKHFGLPEPLRISASSEDEVVYLMRKANGTQLGRFVIGHVYGKRANPKPYFADALHYLAFFHAWGGPRSGTTPRQTLKDEFRKCLSHDFAAQLADEFHRDWPLVRKKDAHPENWLCEGSGRIIMLDFEASALCPLLLDTVQLLDDYPLLATNTSGWNERLGMVSDYLERLQMLGFQHRLDARILETAYAALVTYRCAFGLRYQGREHQKASERDSISTLNAIRTRVEHYRNLLDFIIESGPTESIRAVARGVLDSQRPAQVQKPRTPLDPQSLNAFS